MADVSKLARARMAKAPVAGPHPEADLLNAFAERSVTPAEREQVLAHLATCAECREVVALAAPQTVPLEQPVLVPRRSRWMPVGLFRWGSMAAAIAVVAIVVIVESPKYEQQTAPLSVAKTERNLPADAGFASNEPSKQKVGSATAPEAKAEVGQEQTAQLKSEAVATKKEAGPNADMDKLAAAAPLPAPPAPPTQAGRAKQAEKTDLAKAQTPGNAGGLVRPAPAVASDATVSVSSAQPTVEPTEVAGNMAATRSAPAAQKTAHSGERAEYDEYYAGAAPAAGAGAGTGMAINGMRDAHVRGVAYKWTVTSDGRVQRSSDGRTWFYVLVDPKARLRALASDGDEVWAGGDRGALYHSTDSGNSWNKVPVDRVNGDIIRLVINGDTIQISTSSGQTISMSHDAFTETPVKPASPR